MKYSIFVVIFLVVTLFSSEALPGQSAHTLLRKGDKNYSEGDYVEAEENYRKALEKRPSVNGSYNLGNTIYQQERFEEAIKRYESAAAKARDEEERAFAFHNLGNAYFENMQYDKSVEAFKDALRNRPADMETKQNLALAQKMLKMQQQQQQDQQQNENQENQQQDQQEQQPEQPQDENQQNQQNNEQNREEQTPPKDLTKEEARKLLEIMEDEERKVQEKMRKSGSKKSKSKKDW